MIRIGIKKTNPEFIKAVKEWRMSKKERFEKYFEEIKQKYAHIKAERVE